KELVLYISMGFGNPYGDEYNADVAIEWVGKLADLGIKTIAMSDTVGVAQPESIRYIFSQLIPQFPGISIGAHFHSTIESWEEKIESAYQNGCVRFDSALNGIGGCPMAKDDMVDNMPTDNIVDWCDRKNRALQLDREALEQALQTASRIFI